MLCKHYYYLTDTHRLERFFGKQSEYALKHHNQPVKLYNRCLANCISMIGNMYSRVIDTVECWKAARYFRHEIAALTGDRIPVEWEQCLPNQSERDYCLILNNIHDHVHKDLASLFERSMARGIVYTAVLDTYVNVLRHPVSFNAEENLSIFQDALKQGSHGLVIRHLKKMVRVYQELNMRNCGGVQYQSLWLHKIDALNTLLQNYNS